MQTPLPAPLTFLLQLIHSRSLVDIGWLPPLYYTAVRCNFSSLRLRAVELMEAHSHRDGFWGSTICARVGRALLDLPAMPSEVRVHLSDDYDDGIKVGYRLHTNLHWEEMRVFI